MLEKDKEDKNILSILNIYVPTFIFPELDENKQHIFFNFEQGCSVTFPVLENLEK